MRDAARMQLLGMDAMRYLGANPSEPADETEQTLMRLVMDVAIREQAQAIDRG